MIFLQQLKNFYGCIPHIGYLLVLLMKSSRFMEEQ